MCKVFAVLLVLVLTGCAASVDKPINYRAPKNFCDQSREYMVCNVVGRTERPSYDSCRCVSKGRVQ